MFTWKVKPEFLGVQSKSGTGVIKSFAFVKTELLGDKGFNATKCHSFAGTGNAPHFCRMLWGFISTCCELEEGYLGSVSAGQSKEKPGSPCLGLCTLVCSLGSLRELSEGISCASPHGNPNSGTFALGFGSWWRGGGWDEQPPPAPRTASAKATHFTGKKNPTPCATLGRAWVFHERTRGCGVGSPGTASLPAAV